MFIFIIKMKEMPALTEDYCPNVATNHLPSSTQPFPASKPSKFKSMFLSIIFGQLLSVILSGTNIFVVLLNRRKIKNGRGPMYLFFFFRNRHLSSSFPKFYGIPYDSFVFAISILQDIQFLQVPFGFSMAIC